MSIVKKKIRMEVQIYVLLASLDLYLEAANSVLRLYKLAPRGLCGLWFNS